MLGAIAIKFLAEVVEVADEIVAVAREMLAEGWPGKLRSKTLWKAQVLREPAEAALIAEIEMKPKPAVTRGGFETWTPRGALALHLRQSCRRR